MSLLLSGHYLRLEPHHILPHRRKRQRLHELPLAHETQQGAQGGSGEPIAGPSGLQENARRPDFHADLTDNWRTNEVPEGSQSSDEEDDDDYDRDDEELPPESPEQDEMVELPELDVDLNPDNPQVAEEQQEVGDPPQDQNEQEVLGAEAMSQGPVDEAAENVPVGDGPGEPEQAGAVGRRVDEAVRRNIAAILRGEVPDEAAVDGEAERGYMTAAEYEDEFMDLYLKHPSMSKAAAADIIKLTKKYAECGINDKLRVTDVQAALQRETKSFRTLERTLVDDIPEVHMDIDLVDMGPTDEDITNFDKSVIVESELVQLRGFTKFPKKLYGSYRYFEYRSETYIKTKDAIHFMLRRHGLDVDSYCEVLLGVDGVREKDSPSSPSLEIVFLVLLSCPKHAIAVRIGRSSYSNATISSQDITEKVIKDIIDMNGQVKVYAMVSDKPARSKINHLLQQNSPYSCEYCVIVGVMITWPVDNEDNMSTSKKVSFRWLGPSEPKKKEEVERIMNNIRTIPKRHRQGYTARSMLLDLPGFDIVTDVVVEYMHGICLGLQKKLIQLCFDFDISEVPQHLLFHLRMKPSEYENSARDLKIPSDFNRGVQRFEAKGMKGEELRNFTLCSCFAYLSRKSPRQPLIRIQLIFSYLVRAYLLPDDEFEACKARINLVQLSYGFQEYYQEIFHAFFHVYYSHMFVHLEEIRAKGPLTLTSMFGPEGMFGWLLDGIQLGTCSIAKQGMQRILSRYQGKKHRCWKRIVYSPYVEGQRKNDSIAYRYNRTTKQHDIYRVLTSNPKDKTCVAAKLNVAPYISDIGCYSGSPVTRLNFGLVGVYVNQGLEQESRTFSYRDFDGKGMAVDKLITLLPKHVLQESN